ncbi:hypothetical protein BGW36DRAFT_304887 [Talaromyces proteolyticus]|uniref:DUF3500 domain-containing protein n=1 Tax=Talaromyces proteolyticus TaxID=1131652 RepID=A0AAD4KFQ5_9EURO|nr:uncharacterized protein BGW36DRAFT_304887 [Talaromyces proteolyticus]KAH8691273.1 hypothetical protein BGW36DRAFT_304887 [Talaromyces proteolyticus]
MAEFREWLDLSSPQVQRVQGEDAVSYTDKLFREVPLVVEMNQKWDQLWKEPFKGLTTDGSVIPDLYPVQDDNILIASIVQAANSVVMALSEVEKDRCLRPLDAPERRAWSNPELYVHRFGVRLDEVNQEVFSAVRQLMKSTLSAEGYEKACTAMRINGFLGRLVNGSKVLNENSYNILLFGQPSTVDPWGWSIYGHHLCLNVFLHKRQIIISPTFTGAEPTTIDSGPFQGSRLFEPEEQLGLRFMQRLPSQLQVKAQIYKEMHDPAMPAWRFNPADQRHICGAFQDNRIVPYEGVCLTELDPSFTDLLLQIVRQFLLYLPQQAYENRRRQILKHSSETYFSWIGGFTDTDPFYYRIQSPVIVCEFDHHSGVFLSNSKPAKFHTHTIVRSPNAGDYGYTLINS